MKIRVRRQFKYTFDNVRVYTLDRGEYEAPRQVSEEAAKLAIQLGFAVIVPAKVVEKEAPENKAVEAPETKKKRSKRAK